MTHRVLIFTAAVLVSALVVSAARADFALSAAGGAPARAAWRSVPVPAVLDHAGFFKPPAVEQARAKTASFRERFHRDLVIETFPHVPEAERAAVAKLSSQKQDVFMQGWARERAASLRIDGVYILVCKNPRHVVVQTAPNADDAGFPRASTESLRALLVRGLARDPDKALLDAVKHVEAQLTTHLAAPGAKPTAGLPGVMWLLGAVAGVLGLTAVLYALRPRAKREPAEAAPAANEDEALKPGLLGGLFGTAAGHWIYDVSLRRPGRPLDDRDADVIAEEPPAVPAPSADEDAITKEPTA